MKSLEIFLLANGSGHNAEYILKAAQSDYFPFKVKGIICNGSKKCSEHLSHILNNHQNTAIFTIDNNEFNSKHEFEKELLKILFDYGAPLLVSCSFNRLLSGDFIDSYPNDIINSHPSLLPAFPGRKDNIKAVDAGLIYGVKIFGATVHFIDSGMDTGPIIIQGAIAKKINESRESLINRVLDLEAILKIQALCWFAESRVEYEPGSRYVKILKSEEEREEGYLNSEAIISPKPDPFVLSKCLESIII